MNQTISHRVIKTLFKTLLLIASLFILTSSALAATFTADLHPGMNHPEVKALQQFLNQTGYPVAVSGDGSKGMETTIMGPATVASLKRYQVANGISQTGIVGEKTRVALNRAQATVTIPKPTPTYTPPVVTTTPQALFTVDLYPGQTHPQIKQLQQFLNRIGYTVALSGDGSRGLETMTQGPATVAALKRFQTAQGINPTGIVGELTRAALNRYQTPVTTTPIYKPTTPVVSVPKSNITFTANPTIVKYNKKAKLTWQAPDANYCLTSFNKSRVGSSGSFTTKALRATSTFSITCYEKTGTVSTSTLKVGVSKKSGGGGGGGGGGSSSTPTPVAGVCSSSDNQAFASAPTTNLCTTGDASAVSGSGPFTWSCTGSSGGATASCSATLTPAATAVTLSGPTSGLVSVASTNFTVGANGTISGTVTVTPAATGGGTFSPTSVALTSGSPTATFTYTPASIGSKTISITNNGGLTNPSNITYTVSVTDTTAPTITSISSDTANGVYNAGDTIDIDVTFSEAVTSTGNVTVTLETGTTDRTCTFTVSASLTGTCTYTVLATDTSADLTVSSVGGTIRDAASNAMTNFVPTTNLAANKALVIDTTNPTGSISAPASAATVSGNTTVTATVSDNVAIASVQFRLDGASLGSADTTNPYTITWDTTATANGSHTLSAVVTDTAGNTLTTSGVSVTVSNTVSATALTLSGPSSGIEDVASTNFTVGANGTISGTVTVTPAATGGGAFSPTSVNLTSGSPTATFTYTPATTGVKTISITNNGGLSNPSNITYTSNALGTTLTSFTLTAPSTLASAPFTIGHAFKQGDVPSGFGIVLTGADAQATVKNTWPDGSAKIAILSGTASLTADTPATINLSAGSASTGTVLTTTDLKNTGITASISAGAFGSASWATTDWDSPFQSWIAGHKMSSWTYRKQVGSDTHLVAWMEVRLYDTGEVEVLPWVENGYLKVAGGTNKNATYTFTLGGTSRFSQAINLLGRQRTPLVSGTALSYWLATDPVVTPRHDVAYLQDTRLVPEYMATISPSAGIVTGLPSTYTPLQQGSMPAGMGSAGYDPSIGLLPEWDVLYLTTTAPTVWAALQRNAYSAGRYGFYVRDANTNRPAEFSDHGTLVMDDTSGIVGVGASSNNNYVSAVSGGGAPTYNSTHSPAMGYMAYLVTGRHYHMETVQFQAVLHYLKNTDTNRRGSQGILFTQVGSNTVRGAAWSLRTLAQAVNIGPVDDPVAIELKNSLELNIDEYYDQYVGNANNPLGFVQPYSDYSGVGDNKYFEAAWQQDFFTMAFGMMKSFDLNLDTTTKDNLTDFFAWKAQAIIGRLGGTSVTDYLYRDAAPYTISVAPTDSPDYETGTGPWYNNWGEVYEATNDEPNPGTLGDLRGGNFPGAESYWGNLMPAISYAVEHGVSGADAAYLRMIEAGNWSLLEDDFDSYPVWGVVPPVIPSSAPATALTLSGPSSGVVNNASTNFTVGANGTISGTVTVTPAATGGGTFSPTSVNLTSGSPTATFTYTPASTGSKTISITNNGGLTNPSNLTYTVSALSVTLSGPASGVIDVASTNFTVGANGTISGTVTVTPAATGGGTFSPTTVNISSGSPTATFTYTPASTGVKTISVTNNGGLTNPSNLTYTVTDVPTDLVAAYSFSEGTGLTTVDISGNNNTGTLTGGPTWTTGKNGNGLNFDGTNDYVALGNLDVAGSELTLSAWINADTLTTTDARIISKTTGTAEADHYFMISTTNSGGMKLRARLKTGGTTTTLIASSGTVTTGTWIHVALVYNGSTMKLYQDGVEVGSTAKTGALSTSASVPVAIGANPQGTSIFDGTIDDVRIYNRALTVGEIQTDMTTAVGEAPPAADALTLSGPSSGTVNTASTNFTVGANGTISGTVTVTPAATGGGTFSPTTVALSSATTTATFTYTPASTGVKTISITNDGALTNPSAIAYTASPINVTLSGPSAGLVSATSTNFTVGADGTISGTVTVTPAATGGGTFTPITVNISSGSPTATFTYTPTSTGTKAISVTNNGGLGNPSNLSYVVGDGSVPDWFANQTPGTWISIAGDSGQRIQDVLPSPIPHSAQLADQPSSIASAWTGGAVDQDRGEYMLCANGGHADYPGNECYALSMRETTPSWRRLTDPTPNNMFGDLSTESSTYLDGRPRSMHSTFQCFGDGRIWYPMQNSVTSQAGGSIDRVVAFNRDALGSALSPLAWTSENIGPWELYSPVWESLGVWTGGMIFGQCAFDPVGHKVWAMSGHATNNSALWSVETQGVNLGQSSAYLKNSVPGSWSGGVAIADDLRILVALEELLDEVTVLTIDTPNAGNAIQRVTNITGTGLYTEGAGCIYIRSDHSLLCGSPVSTGKTIYRLQIPTTVQGENTVYDSTGQWVWTQLNPSGPAPVVALGNSGANSKWNIIEDMGNGQSALVYLGDITAGTYVYKIPPVTNAFTLTGPTSGSTGSPATFTVTPTGGALSSGGTVSVSAPGATLSTTTLTFASGATLAQTFTVTRVTDGTSTVSITNSLGLTNTGSPISFVTGDYYPAWRSSMSAWEWKEISGSSLLVSPTPQPTGALTARVNAWNGMATIGSKLAMAGVGGHADYAGNEGYSIDLSASSPVWTLLSQPTPVAQYTFDQDYYSDGLPTSSHTYYDLFGDASRNRVFRMGIGSGWGSGNHNSVSVDAFNLTSNTWDTANTWADMPENSGIAKAKCQNLVTGDVYAVGNTRLLKWSASSATWTSLAFMPENGTAVYYRSCVFDTVRNKIVVFGDEYRTPTGILVYDVAGNTWSNTSNLSGTYATEVASQAGHGAYYDAGLDRYLVKTGNAGELIEVHPTTYATSLRTTTNSIAVPDAYNGVFGKFASVPDLGGYAYLPEGSENVWFLASE